MTYLKSSIFFILALAISGCGGKKETTNMTLVLGGVINSIVGQDGGTMIYGRQLSGGNQSFAIKLPFNQDLELPNGQWNFSAVSWDGDGSGYQLEGTTRCGVTVSELLGGEQSVNLVLSTGGCASQFFGDDQSKESTFEPKKFEPVSCAKVDSKDKRIDKTECPNSVAQSFKVELIQKGLGGQYFPGITSRCIAETTVVTAELDHGANLRIPMFLPTGSDNAIIKLTAYEDTVCTQSPQVTTITQPLAGAGSRPIDLDSDGVFNKMYFYNSPCEGFAGTQATPFVGGSDRYICTDSQVATYMTANPSMQYRLGTNLDFTTLSPFTGPIVNSAFTGSFDGQGFTIKNISFNTPTIGSVGLFMSINGTVRNLKLENVSFVSASNSFNNFGALAGIALNGVTIDNVSVSNVSMDLVGGSGPTNFGGMIGYYNSPSTPGAIRNVVVNNANFQLTGHKKIGGLIGFVDGAQTFVENAQVHGISIDNDNTGGGRVGGAIGEANNGAKLRNILVDGLALGATATIGGGPADRIGGVVGMLGDGSFLKFSKAQGYINSSTNNVGGVVGHAEILTSGAVSIEDSISEVSPIRGIDRVGGILGFGTSSTANIISIIRSRHLGPTLLQGLIECDDFCGGLVGDLAGTATHEIKKSWAKNSLVKTVGASPTRSAGFVSKADNILIDQCFAEVDVSNNNIATLSAGLLASATTAATISDSYFIGDINNAADRGLIMANGFNATLARLYAIGTADKGDYALGTPTSVLNVYSDISVTNGSSTQTSVANIKTGSLLTNFTAAVWTDLTGAGDGQFKTHVSYEPYKRFAARSLGTYFDPFVILTPAGWNSIGDESYFMGAHFKLGLDLDFDSITFKPISSIANQFFGTIDGNGRVIKNIIVSETSTSQPLGLVRRMNTLSNSDARNPGIFNLTLLNVDFESDENVGAFVGVASDDTTNVNFGSYAIRLEKLRLFNSMVSHIGANNMSAGGIAAVLNLNNGQTQVKDIIVSGSTIDSTSVVSATSGLGGVIGKVLGTGTNPSSKGRFESVISANNNINTSTIVPAGGVFGLLDSTKLEFNKIISNNTISANTDVGGVVGRIDNGIISEAYAKGSVSGTTNVGGFVGQMSAVGNEIKGSYSTAAVNGTTFVAGFAGKTNGVGKIENSWSAPSSLVGSAFEGTGDNPAAATKPLVYVGLADDGFANTTFVSDADLKNPANLGVYFNAVDPFLSVSGTYPRPYFEVFPQYFLD